MSKEPDRFEELLQSPYEQEPRSKGAAIVAGVCVVIVIVIVAAGLALLAGGDSEGSLDAPVATTSNPAPGASGGGVSVTTTTADLNPGIGPEPAFDPVDSGYGYEEALDTADESQAHRARQAWDSSGFQGGEAIVVGYSPSLMRGVVQADDVDTSGRGVGIATGGGPARCIAFTDFAGASSTCWTVDESGLGRPVLEGQELWLDIVAWVDLPDTASVGVLTVNSDFIAWQRPRFGVVVFQYAAEIGDVIELTVLDAEGDVLGVLDRTAPVIEVAVEPITGYGDFSDAEYDSIDWYDVQERIVACLNDHDIEATLPARSSTSPDHVPGIVFPDQDSLGADVGEMSGRCRAGLNLPEPVPSDPEDLYDYFVSLHECLAERRYDTGPLPTFEEWIEQPIGTRWDPTGVFFRQYDQEETGSSGDDSALPACAEEARP